MSATWDQAAARWLREKRHKATHLEDAAKLRWLEPHLCNSLLATLDGDLILKVAELKASETSLATANRYLALVRAVLNRAMEVWRWIDRVPVIPLYPETQRRVRWLDPQQVRILLDELPPHQRAVVLFALATGLRQGNVLGLEWANVDLDRKLAVIHADQAKARKTISVPLSLPALSVLRSCLGHHPVSVFCFRGRPLRSANTRAWRHALVRAGITDFRWHDLRHTWASWHAQQGTPLYVLQELGAWSSETMVRRYAHLAPHHYAEHAETISQFLLDL